MTDSGFKKFKGNKPLATIREQCKAQGVSVDDSLLSQGQSDYIVLTGGGARVLYNTFNGGFFGTTPNGTKFSADSNEHEACEWFQQLMAFFYLEKDD